MRFASFFGMLEHWSGVAPDAPALIHEENGEKRAVSYAQLLAAVRDRAEVLKNCAGRCEAILADGSYECVVEVFAAVAAGLPVALLDANTEYLDPETFLPILKDEGEWIIVSLRGATGWIHKD